MTCTLWRYSGHISVQPTAAVLQGISCTSGFSNTFPLPTRVRFEAQLGCAPVLQHTWQHLRHHGNALFHGYMGASVH